MKIGIVGSRFYNNGRKIKNTIHNLKLKFGENLTIISGGCSSGADRFAKKYALELGCKYREYNPAHTPKNLYSALYEKYYNKEYSPKHFFHRNRMLAKDSNYIIAFIPENIKSNGAMDTIKHAKKFGKKVVIIN